MRGAIIKFLAISALILFFINFISAGILVGNHSIEKSYAPGSTIRGWLEITLDKESTDSILGSSFGGSISLIDLLNKTSNLAFIKTCIPLSCTFGYSANNEEDSKILSLEKEEVLIGFNLTSSKKYLVGDITDFYFNVSSNNVDGVEFPLAIDVLDDGQYEWNAYTASEEFSSDYNSGCFAGVGTTSKPISYETQFCEKISLTRAPKVELGAYVKGSGTSHFSMSIKEVGSSSQKGCDALASGEGIQKISCEVPEFSVDEDKDYFVCIKTPSAGYNDKYTIEMEEDSNNCGFIDDFDGTYDRDYEIFARQRKFANIKEFIFNDAELVKAKSPVTNVKEYVKEYVSEKYNNNCSKGCIIPMRIFSGVTQEVTIDYSTGEGRYVRYISDGTKFITDIYDLAKTSAQISSASQKLYLDDAGFSIPAESGNYSLLIKLNDEELFSEEVIIKEIATIQSLSPMKTAVGYPTKFRARTDASVNITQYTWEFGDGNIETTNVNIVNYTYNSVGDYMLKISVVDANGGASNKTFNITVGPASAIVPTIITGVELSINNIKEKTALFSELERNSVHRALDLETIESTITRLKDTAARATSETEFQTILGELLGISLPKTISKTASGDKILFYPISENINLEVLKKIGAGDYTGKEEDYKTAIFAWNEANINTILTYSEISAIYESDEVPFLKIFDVNVDNTGEEAYIFIKELKDISFEGVSPKKDSGYYYLNLGANKNTAFSTTDNVNFITLPMFISPSLTKLTILEISPTTDKEGGKAVTITILIILVFVIAIIVWTILQIWYKRKYENFLFKDRNHLYNMVNYIGTEKDKGTNEKDISVNLKKTGWTSEQVSYALKKYAGRNTGMLQILPVDKIFDKMFGVNRKIKAPPAPKKVQ